MSEGPQIIPWAPPGTNESPFANNNPDGQPRSSPPPLIQSSAEFTRGFVPPDYLIDGILQRRFCYSLTATTGTGKTAIMLRVSAHVALGRAIKLIKRDRDGITLTPAGEKALEKLMPTKSQQEN